MNPTQFFRLGIIIGILLSGCLASAGRCQAPAEGVGELQKQQKILVLAGVLPAIADIIEDLNDNLFRQNLKRLANQLHSEIRKNDEMILRETGVKLSEEQVNITRAFNLWINKNFDVEEAQKLMIETLEKEEKLKNKFK
jgi:hypothetical protein